jgi:hypothetical protein
MTHRRIDNKHSIIYDEEDGTLGLAKRLESGELQPIPPTEPVILFRARDLLALPMLRYYRQLCVADGCTNFQLSIMDDMIDKFAAFAAVSPTMKQPGVTKGR